MKLSPAARTADGWADLALIKNITLDILDKYVPFSAALDNSTVAELADNATEEQPVS